MSVNKSRNRACYRVFAYRARRCARENFSSSGRDAFPVSVSSSRFSRFASTFESSREAANSLFALLFPDLCRVCNQPLESFTAVPVCDACLRSIRPYEGLECGRCGLFLEGPAPLHGSALCGLCRRGAFVFDEARSFGRYEGVLQAVIQRFKYDGFRPLARPLAAALLAAMRRLQPKAWDGIVPVPLHRNRQRERGFNQAALLAARFSRLCGIPMEPEDCVRVRDTRPQTGLRATQRRNNVAGAFHVPVPQRVQRRRLLLVDDVLTTGATVNACAQALLEAGAEGVWVVTLARAHPARADVL